MLSNGGEGDTGETLTKLQNAYHVKVVVVRVANSQVATIQVHLPRHLLRTILFHLFANDTEP